MPGTVMPAPKFVGLDNNANPVSGGKLYTYIAGTSTPQATYSDVNLSVANANPVILDSGGRATVFLSGTSYKFVLADSTDVVIWTQDNVQAVATLSTTLDVEGIAGETILAGQACYLSDGSGALTAGRWYLADADTAYASSLPQIAVAPSNIASGENGTFRLQGSCIKANGQPDFVPGATYYISGTAGFLSATPGTNLRVMGQADSTTTIIIAPNPPNVSVTPTFTNGVTVTSTDGGATAGPYVDLYRDSASPAAADQIGEILFTGEDSAGNKQTYARVYGQIADATSTSEDGQIRFATTRAGTTTLALVLDETGQLLPDTANQALGSATKAWADLFLESGGVVNFNNGETTLTQSASTLTLSGSGAAGLDVKGPLRPTANDGAALGASGTAWADLFLASGGIINFNAGDVTIRHSSNALLFEGASSGYLFDAEIAVTNNGRALMATRTTTATNTINGPLDVTLSNASISVSDGFGPAVNFRLTDLESNNALLGSIGIARAGADNTGDIVLRPASAGATNERLRITSGGDVAIGATAKLFLDGVAATGNTYLQEVSADVIAMVAGGTEVMRVNGVNGNVAIGTSTPTASVKLDVRAALGQVSVTSTTGTNSARYLVNNDGGTLYVGLDSSTGGNFSGTPYAGVLWNTANAPMVFGCNNGEKFRLTATGDIGMVATAKLFLDGTAATGNTYLQEVSADTIVAFTNGTERLRINSSGNVGIGTNSPVGRLDVASAAPVLTIRNTSAAVLAGNTVGSLNYYTDDTSTLPNRVVASMSALAETNYVGTDNAPTSLVFSTHPNVERFRLNGSGVAILGSGEASATPTGNTLRAPSGTGTDITGGTLTITAGNGTGTGGSGNIIFQTAPPYVSTGTGGNSMLDRLRIDNQGNVGLGVTPSASVSPHLQFSTNAIISGSGNAYFSNNAVYNGAWKYVASSQATMQYQMTTNGHQFNYAAAGTAGNAITFTAALGINTSGHVGIAALSQFYLDGTAGTGDTYLHESSANNLSFVTGGTERLRLTSSGDTAIPATAKLYLDGVAGTGNTYITEFSSDVVQIITNGASAFIVDNAQNIAIAATKRLYFNFSNSTYITESAANVLSIYTNSAERVQITSTGTVKTFSTVSVGNATPASTGAGITFPATQSASSDANTLDDYEESSYTATLTPATSGTVTLDAAFNQLAYTKVGRLVTVNGRLKVSSVGSPSGAINMNLPFTGATLTDEAGSFGGGMTLYDTSVYSLIPFGAGSGATVMSIVNWTPAANHEIYLSFSYVAA